MMVDSRGTQGCVRHDREHHVFELLDQQQQVIGELNYMEVQLPGGTAAWNLVHTGVRPQYRGQGLGAVLVAHAVDAALRAERKIIPTCPYVRVWLRKHPEYQSLTY